MGWAPSSRDRLLRAGPTCSHSPSHSPNTYFLHLQRVNMRFSALAVLAAVGLASAQSAPSCLLTCEANNISGSGCSSASDIGAWVRAQASLTASLPLQLVRHDVL